MINQSIAAATVLIVDDSATLRYALKVILEAANIKVIGLLPSGHQLLETIRQSPPDIVCLDYNLPGVNGLELLESIVSQHPQVAVLMITGDPDPELQRTAAESGAAGFISKPFSQEQVIKEIRHIIQTKHLLSAIHKPVKDVAENESVVEYVVKKTAIVADDSKTMRALLTAILSGQGIDVVAEATNGAQAIGQVALHQPDIVCLDIDMPTMDGLAALREIREHNPATKVLMITGNTKREVVVEALARGAIGFVVKPFDPEKVGNAIKKALSV